MIPDNLKLLFSDKQIDKRIRELAALISADYHGRHLIIVGVLKGCFVFLADIIRNLDLDVTVDFVQVASYGACRESSGVSTLEKDLGTDIGGHDVLIVEDIVDTGETLAHLIAELQERFPASVRVCALLNKQARRRAAVAVDYIGFELDDVFVVGCGLDFDERFRGLPGIYALPEAAPV